MKKVFLEARDNTDIKVPQKLIDALPEKIGLMTTVQHIGQLKSITEQLLPKKTYYSKGTRCTYPGQVLGCDIGAALDIDVDAYLYIGSGTFHPKLLLLTLSDMDNKKPVFKLNPISNKWEQLDYKIIKKMQKQRNGALAKYLTSKKIGILVSTKHGQCQLERALKFKKKIEKDKKPYILLADTLDFDSLENFPFIECYINTMCDRIGYDDSIRLNRPIINIDTIEQFLKQNPQ